MKIVEHLGAAGSDVALFAPSRKLNDAIARLLRDSPGKRAKSVATRLSRGKAPTGVEVVPVTGALEARRLVGLVATRQGWGQAISFDLLKQEFDRRVAASHSAASGIFIGMPGASLQSFRATAPGTLRVLHEVDAPPHAHNRALLQHYRAADLSRELLPERVAKYIEQEIAESDVVLSPSSLVTAQLREFHANVRVLQVPYGVDFDKFRPVRVKDSPTAAERSRPTLIYVGQISRRKGIPFLLDAIEGTGLKLDLVGPIVEPGLLARLPSEARYLGTLPHDALRDRLAAADAFVFPSIEDNFGLAVAEAVASGLPVIATADIGAVEVIPMQDVTIVPAGDASSLRAAMESVHPQSLHERAERAERARGENSAILSWPEYVERVKTGLEEYYVQQ
ncbi:glycosyltransferase family 4 protein [Microbacterium testaceum]|uniref:glycosyltransferase family 4 protein n=1 Tax=Microbacterium testaceum TaxID=2033 RepID=UPI001D171D62|nr:glycosyltransferase family 4 protein [Microbacterium testaceum]MCC4249431.1 glycosyltransferase family 4 protein [Microbacterium testaceum]